MTVRATFDWATAQRLLTEHRSAQPVADLGRWIHDVTDQLLAALAEIDRLAGEERRATVHAEHQARLQRDEHEARLISEAEVARLTARRDELLKLVAKLTRETPYPAELDECRAARAALIAEVGTLRAEATERRAAMDQLEDERDRMRPVVEAAEWVHGGRYSTKTSLTRDDRRLFDRVNERVDAYREKEPT